MGHTIRGLSRWTFAAKSLLLPYSYSFLFQNLIDQKFNLTDFKNLMWSRHMLEDQNYKVIKTWTIKKYVSSVTVDYAIFKDVRDSFQVIPHICLPICFGDRTSNVSYHFCIGKRTNCAFLLFKQMDIHLFHWRNFIHHIIYKPSHIRPICFFVNKVNQYTCIVSWLEHR